MAAVGMFLSRAVTKLFLVRGDKHMGEGSGVFYWFENDWYLVSAWHVFSGINSLNKKPLNIDGAVPNKIMYTFPYLTGDQIGAMGQVMEIGNPIDGDAIWYEHPIEGLAIDVGVLKIKDGLDVGYAPKEVKGDPNYFVDVGQEVFVPGYPLGLADAGHMPIWKRASIATSLEFGEGMNRKILIDTKGCSGMSGAPVFAMTNDYYYRKISTPPEVERVNKPISYRLIGIYSGRVLQNRDISAELGIVWRENLIDEIIRAKQLATIRI